MTRRGAIVLGGLFAAVCVLFLLGVLIGTTAIGLDQIWWVLTGRGQQATQEIVILQVRLPRALTALLAGAALGAAGLQMQTLFANPLADPFSLGVSSGASLGVALLVMGVGTLQAGAAFAAGLGLLARFGTVVAAAVGSAAILVIVAALSRFARSPAVLLVVGVLLGGAVSALVSLLLTWTDPERAVQFIAWGLGSFSGTTWNDLVIFVPCVVAALLLTGLNVKTLNALLLGENYARSLGVSVRRARAQVLTLSSLLTAAVTAFCGPVGFLGIAAPHAARRMLGTSEHRLLLPATALTGACLALACSVVATTPTGLVPINVITSLLGAPVVIAILLRSHRLQVQAS